ncbi:cytochrome P450 [Actinomadura barringtoniae]|uniref:Cytochrome P450 n=1 Tax=Actinomadura barringtoniae TaxID=1427535 RepID=A0A939PV73_9ACTN|nr:cytochrome P450 [Actinomadura barringtoniae]MBO2455614.1 cytochrome P450 [Actinomadura barringtoniae]
MLENASNDPILSLAHPETLPDPYPAYARLRAERPVFFYERLGSWMFTRHADCVAVLRDSTRFAADWRRVGERVPPRAINMLTLDPPEHTTVRRPFMEALREPDGAAMEPLITARCAEILAGLEGRSFDVVTELAEPLALAATAIYLGVPEPDGAWLSGIGRAIGAGMDAGLWPERAAPVQAAHEELAVLVEGWLADPPETGVLASVASRAGSSGIAPDVLANTVRGLLFSGYSSGSKMLALIAAAVLHERAVGLKDVQAAADPVRAIEELVRYASPIQAVARACVTDVEIGGTQVKAGQAVTLLLGAANRDPGRFPEPNLVRLDRHPNPHLGFGRGPKSCLGQPFSAVFLRVVLDLLATRYPETRAVGEPTFQKNLTLRSLDHFEATLA